jgi:hypothetical protein
MGTSWTITLILAAALGGADPGPPRAGIFEGPGDLAPQGKIDELVFARLKQRGIQPAGLCSDGVFVRRVYLDVIGTLPTAEEARQFLQDRDPNKRRVLIDRLLGQRVFGDYRALKWSDLLRVKGEFPINLWPNAAQAYHRWIVTSLRENKPYDQFVRELLTSSGSNFRVPPVNFYRAMQSKDPATTARTVALTFMGERAQNWPKERLAGMAVFFSQIGYKPTKEWKEEIVFFDLAKAVAPPADGAAPAAVFPDGKPARLSPDKDPRVVFADWLIAPDNPWFARNIVNRTWYWLLGRGIIHEPDDGRPDNPPSNPELLAWLAQELVAAKYDLKHIYRVILNSNTYQLSAIPPKSHPEGAAQFAYYPLRRLEAEVLIDAVCEITGTGEKYSSETPEPFTFIPEGRRTIALADGSVTSPFLEMFGRPPRDTGLEAERSNRPSPAQRLHILNSSHIQRKIRQGPKLQRLLQASGGSQEIAEELYLTILSRFPTQEELKTFAEYAQSGIAPGREALLDLAWALMNSVEFLYRH